MPIHTATHPLIAHKMTLLRSSKTNAADFRRILKEISFYLGYEASRDIKTVSEVIQTPLNADFNGVKISDKVAIIPILRAGLSMADGMLDLMPHASVHHIGMYRCKDSLLPVQYYNRLPKNSPCDVAYIVDPCIATSNTISAVVSIVKKWGAKKVVVISSIASREGIDKLIENHPDIDVYTAAIDEKLSEDGMIIPGIGDAGDRQYSTFDLDAINDDSVTAGSKRAREE